MSTPLPKLRTKYGESVGVEIFFSFPEILDEQRTYLDADSAAGATSFSANGINFAANQYIVIGQPGNLRTEIIKINSAPTATTIPLASAASFAHNRGDIVRFIPFNQIEAQYSTDGVSYNVITPFDIRADSSESYLQRTSDASTYSYKFRFYNSTSTLYSPYSATSLGSGFGDGTIGAVKARALEQLGEQKSSLITDGFLNDAIQEARRTMDQNPAIFRWSFRTMFGTVLGQILGGQYKIAVPTDLRDQNTHKNVLSLRVGNQNRPMIYQPRPRFNQNYLNVRHSTTNGSTASGATSMVLTSTHDFDSSGTLVVANNAVGTTPLTIVTYTGNNKTTNTLTGCTYNTNRVISTLTDVWQQATFGLPSAYTVNAGYFYFDVPLLVGYDGQDVKIDYYSTIPTISSDSQTFDEPFYDHYVSFLKWKIKYAKSNGKIDRDSDTDYKDWMAGVAMVIAQEVPGQVINFIPDIEGFLSSTE